MGQSKGRTIGDVVFIYQGKPVIIFRQISDPHGVARLAKTARKRIITAIQNANKIKERNIKIVKLINKGQYQKNDNNFSIDNSTLINNMIMCHKCGYKNKSGSNFCNECGNNLQIQIANKQIANKQIADKFLEFQSPQYNFKINYPAKWQKRDKLPEGLMKVIFLSQSENLTDPFLEALSVSIEISNYTPIEWIEANIDHMKNKYSDFGVIESLPTTLANLPAHQLVYTDGGNQSLYVYQSLCVATKKGNSIYFILYRAQKEKYLKFLPIIEQVICSFQFIE